MRAWSRPRSSPRCRHRRRVRRSGSRRATSAPLWRSLLLRLAIHGSSFLKPSALAAAAMSLASCWARSPRPAPISRRSSGGSHRASWSPAGRPGRARRTTARRRRTACRRARRGRPTRNAGRPSGPSTGWPRTTSSRLATVNCGGRVLVARHRRPAATRAGRGSGRDAGRPAWSRGRRAATSGSRRLPRRPSWQRSMALRTRS